MGVCVCEGGGVPSQIDHLLSPLRSFSSVAVSKQLHYKADQIKKKKKNSDTQQYGVTLLQCLNRDKRASDVARSVDSPHRGDLTEMKRRPRCFIMKLLVLWEKARAPHSILWLTSDWDSPCVIFY